MIDRHQTEVAHHQAKIDEQAEQAEREQEEREDYAKTVNWKQVGEDRIRDMSESDKADLLREEMDHRLAAFFDRAVLDLTDWVPVRHPIDRAANIDNIVLWALQTIRDDQAALAEEHYLETGEME